jgi:hypothetical protein
MRTINKMLHTFLVNFVVVFIENILIKIVLENLTTNRFYVKHHLKVVLENLKKKEIDSM